MKLMAFILFLFSIAGLNAPDDTCNLPAPADNGSTHNSTSVTFQWTAVTSATGYRLIVTDLDTEQVVFNDIVTSTTKTITGTNTSHDYRARICAQCSGDSESTNIIIIDLVGA